MMTILMTLAVALISFFVYLAWYNRGDYKR